MNTFIPGVVVSVDVGPFVHYGLISQIPIGENPSIISNSLRSGMVAEESASVFADGKKINIVGYPGNLDPSAVLARAKSVIGKRYNPVTWNCEHFYKWAHGLKVESPQLKKVATISVILIIAMLAIKKK